MISTIRKKKESSIIEVIQVFLASYILYYRVIVRIMDLYVGEIAGLILGTGMLYVGVIVSLVLMLRNVRCIKDSFTVLLVLSSVAIFSSLFNSDSVDSLMEYLRRLVIIGFSGFVVGRSMKKFNLFIKISGGIAFLLGILLILEPINHVILQLKSMELGYILTPIIIALIFRWNSNKQQKQFLILAIILSILTIIFTSRGCGLTLVGVYIALWFQNYSKKISFNFGFMCIIGMCFLLILSYQDEILTYLSRFLDLSFASSSLLSRLLYDSIANDSTRSDLWEYCILLIQENPIVGYGIGADRTLLQNFGGNYPFPHNIFIEMFMQVGIPLTVVLIFKYFIICIKSIKNVTESSVKFMLMSLFLQEWIRLMVSDTYLDNTYTIMFVLGISIAARDMSRMKSNL